MEATAKKIYAPNELICAVAIHPGEMLKDELQARGMSQRKFAGIIGMPYTAFNEIINGKRPITTDTALKIEAATGISATIWLALQTDYNMQTARRDNKLSAILENIRKSVATFRHSGEYTQVGRGSLKDLFRHRPRCNHTYLYDNFEKIPFDRIEAFYRRYLK